MAKSHSYFFKKYNQIPDLSTDIAILKAFTTPPLTIEEYADEIPIQVCGSQSQLNLESPLGEEPDSTEQQATQSLIMITKKTKANSRLNINRDFIGKENTSLNKTLAEYIDFTDIIEYIKNSNGYILVTQSSKSYRIFINIVNIPHLLGLPNMETVYKKKTILNNYLTGMQVKSENYIETIQKMLNNPKLKTKWFNSLFEDISENSSVDCKDNTDKMAYKIACFRTLINSISIGDSSRFGNANSLMTYEYKPSDNNPKDKPKIMSIINIPNTDIYLGLICKFDTDNNYYFLYSIVAFNKDEIKDKDEYKEEITVVCPKDGPKFKRLSNEINTNSNLTFVKSKYIGTQIKENEASKIIYHFYDDYKEEYYDKYKKFNGKPYTVKKQFKVADHQIEVDSSRKNTILIDRILNIINNVTNEDELSKLLPKYLIYIMLTTCNLKYEDFIYNIFIILKTYKYDSNIIDILNKFYSMDEKTFYELIKNKDDNNEAEIGFTISENQISINCCFKYSISNINRIIPFSFTSNDIEDVKNQFKAFISNIYNEILYNDQVVLGVDNIGTDNDNDFIRFSRTIKNLIELQKFGIAFIEEIKSNQKRVSK